jgi:DHA3 family macrolide efflux protein-like MFS transporter
MQRNRNFMLLWLAQWISRAGDTFTFLAIAIRIDGLFVEAGDAARALGGVLFAFALPQLLVGLFAGTLVDRWDRRKVMVVSDLVRAALVPAFLLLRGPADLPWAFAVAFLHSCLSVFFYPARGALLPALVRREELMKANGWLQLGDTIARLSGPVLAGIVIGAWGPSVAFWVDSASFLASALLILGIAGAVTRVAPHEGTAQPAWHDLMEGVRYALQSRLLQGVTLGLGVAMLGIGGIDAVVVPFLRHVFQAPPEALGAVMTAQGLGMLVGGLAISRLGSRLSPLRVAVVSMLMLGTGIVLCGSAPAYGVLLIILPFVGLSIPPLNASLQTMLQQGVPQEMLGRAGAVTDVAITIAQLVSLAGIGWVASLMGMRQTFIVAGALIATGALALRWTLGGGEARVKPGALAMGQDSAGQG